MPGAYPCIQVGLKPGDVNVKSRGGAMVTLDPGMSLTAACEGGCCNGCMLCCLGESFVFNQ